MIIKCQFTEMYKEGFLISKNLQGAQTRGCSNNHGFRENARAWCVPSARGTFEGDAGFCLGNGSSRQDEVEGRWSQSGAHLTWTFRRKRTTGNKEAEEGPEGGRQSRMSSESTFVLLLKLLRPGTPP